MHRKANQATATAAPNGLLQLSLSLALLELFTGGAALTLQGNAYHGLLVAINPCVPEDPKIVSSVKEMITEASFYLFNATQGRVCFGSVKILIPATWKKNTYAKPMQEIYTKADVIIAPPYWKHGHDPYTLQYGGCGEKGKYIHFTSDFLVNNDSVGTYGSHGKLFVHEWAHLRWGVFDEYDSEKPFYISRQNQVKATRCSADLTGTYVCEKESCTEGNCVIDQVTGLLKEGCAFIHDKAQNASSSIMYMQSLSSVFEFCDASNHNAEAPNAQNRMCSYKSTWDVIMSSDDFKFNIPLTSNNFSLPPTFSLLQATDRVICLVLDFSGSINENNWLIRMHQAIEVYLLQIVEDNSYVGIVTFSEVGEIKSQIRQIISADVRKQLASALPVASSGKGANVCTGLQLALEIIKNHDGNVSSSEIILLTSGEDNSLSKCFSDVINIGLIIHTISLGQSVSKELEQLGRMTGGLSFFVSDRPDSNSLIDVFSAIVAGNGAASHHPVQAGDWTYTLSNTHMLPDVLTMTVTSRAIKSDVPTITVRTHTNKDTNIYPSPMIVYAQVSQGFSPILGANVTAVIEPENGDPIILDLFDNGAGADMIKNDGVYSKYLFSFMRNGRYNLKVYVERDNQTIGPYPAMLWSPAMYIPGYITNGTIQMNAPRPLMNSEDMQIRSGGFSRVASGGSFTVSGVPAVPYKDVFPPCKIIDLDARAEDDRVILTWTAPGDDFDQGQAARYEIRISKSPVELRENFENATPVNTSSLTPQLAGSKEIFVFNPEMLVNNHINYVALHTVDKSFLQSDLSNIAQALVLLRKDSLIAPAKNGTLTIVLTTCGLLLLASSCLILSTILSTTQRKRRKWPLTKLYYDPHISHL
ncbi:calcium-activated chloride channel regulator 2-like isoform X2 [Rhineura floridana]|uniref:calcium-activated chloride channel regulator 2-like isoform X2 n=1 Tax=Rhineura floridana TaxID=261503 RepID=UPI002AC87FF9|nr:calcium-activated chloride channel regulator 2-like isoform X2 [Rhineura floridana]